MSHKISHGTYYWTFWTLTNNMSYFKVHVRSVTHVNTASEMHTSQLILHIQCPNFRASTKAIHVLWKSIWLDNHAHKSGQFVKFLLYNLTYVLTRNVGQCPTWW